MSTQCVSLGTLPRNHSHLATPFLSALDSAASANLHDDPNYYVKDPRSLVSNSAVHSFSTGTGSAIYKSFAPLLESTIHELILVTCFWARSSALETLNEVLRNISDKAIRRGTHKVRVRLCFSSSSLFQKLFHSQSVSGQTYPPSIWAEKFGLPDPSELGGLDLQIKSIFILPFSVMHPKFIIIDRQTAILPSCNISWEEWFEGCVTLSGPLVNKFFQFYSFFWARSERPSPEQEFDRGTSTQRERLETGAVDLGHGHIHISFPSNPNKAEIKDVPSIFLPSPHHRNPQFRPFARTKKIIAPPTPLNAFILTIFAKAEASIRIQTPNLTSPPVLSGLLKALARGINVTIVTSDKLMVLEQLITAGTTTSKCVKKLIKRYRKLLGSGPNQTASDEEAAISMPRLGKLQISYFSPLHGPKPKGKEGGEPQQSHLKMTIVDNDVLVLGSGNLDRASWFTSQELGVAFFDKALAESVGNVVDEAMKGRSRVVFNSLDVL
ncbi:hypothetical protein CC78DRAFT_530531 [Lojkania enalia]|uniref:PLD phosphodiesterase domain-containing protein n=1 Tax=Lojkania enalia TaxID=147567 RepID=A0A9P4KFN5_9PLEO|nr:hypothetical protein CC78DRAFT_530531 [Didymosphaeria enalia]